MSALRAIVGAGPRAVEQALFAELERLAPSTLEALAAVPGPVRVVVPSSSLRIHLLAELARRRPAWAGVEILTLRRLARWLYERAGEAPPRGGTLLPILVAREARKERELAGPLEPLEGGYATLVATVRDLVDAGLESIHGHPFAELIAADDVRIALADRPRAAAVARVAQRTAQELERLGLAPGATLLRRAADLLAGRPDLLPPAAAWIVHGFADATGSALDLLETLSRWGPTTLLLDLPESAVGAPRDAGESFGSGLRGRLQQGRRGESAPAIARAELEAFSARGESAEAREVARRIRTDLAANPQLAPRDDRRRRARPPRPPRGAAPGIRGRGHPLLGRRRRRRRPGPARGRLARPPARPRHRRRGRPRDRPAGAWPARRRRLGRAARRVARARRRDARRLRGARGVDLSPTCACRCATSRTTRRATACCAFAATRAPSWPPGPRPRASSNGASDASPRRGASAP